MSITRIFLIFKEAIVKEEEEWVGMAVERFNDLFMFGGQRQRIYMVVLTTDAIRSSTQMVGIGKSQPS